MKMFFSNLMNADDEKIKTSIDKVLSRIKSKESKSKIEDRFLIEFENYGYDVGLLSLLSFNHINLKHGEAIFTPAGIPHAYLEGNIIECMANSDNVVRAGLTPKYKDIDTLIRMLSVDSTDIFVQNVEESGKLIYKTTAEEFQVERINVTNIKISNNKEINILLILNGEVEIIFSGKQSNFFREGEVILIPATLSEFTISTNNKTNLYRVIVP